MESADTEAFQRAFKRRQRMAKKEQQQQQQQHQRSRKRLSTDDDTAGPQSKTPLGNDDDGNKQSATHAILDRAARGFHNYGESLRLAGWEYWDLLWQVVQLLWTRLGRPVAVAGFHYLLWPTMRYVIVGLTLAAVGAGFAAWASWKTHEAFFGLLPAVFSAGRRMTVLLASNTTTTTETTGAGVAAAAAGAPSAVAALVPWMQDFLHGIDYLGKTLPPPVVSLERHQHWHMGALVMEEALTRLPLPGCTSQEEGQWWPSLWECAWDKVQQGAEAMGEHDAGHHATATQALRREFQQGYALLASIHGKPAAEAAQNAGRLGRIMTNVGLVSDPATVRMRIARGRMHEFAGMLEAASGAREKMSVGTALGVITSLNDNMCSLSKTVALAVKKADLLVVDALGEGHGGGDDDDNESEPEHQHQLVLLGKTSGLVRTWHRASAQLCETARMTRSRLKEREAFAEVEGTELEGYQEQVGNLLTQTEGQGQGEGGAFDLAVGQAEAELEEMIHKYLSGMGRAYLEE
ncbi:hypothetical protein QIS74_04922 [Colletotrichum tabaci]|uniref:Uncharacterized protein n=1 Tax=Colletotrichum tabaci TaxID=1209068 RepID=A0AAV9TIU2_9PEZI